jgi:hypothetical protein
MSLAFRPKALGATFDWPAEGRTVARPFRSLTKMARILGSSLSEASCALVTLFGTGTKLLNVKKTYLPRSDGSHRRASP